MKDKLISKFGGSSITCTDDIKTIDQIIEDDPRRKYLVISAPGKRFPEDIKVTQLLVQLAGTKNKKDLIERISERYQEIYPNCSTAVAEKLTVRVNQKLKPAAYMASLKAFGEEMNARLLAKELNAKFIDPKEFLLVTNDYANAKILTDSYKQIAKLKQTDINCIIPGFYGYTKNEEIATFSFGGSDLTGSIFAKGLNVTTYENFTDCPIYAADPRIVNEPKKVEEITYKELRDLSYSGFNIFHQDAVMPLEDTSIPIHIRSTRNYPESGTMVVKERISNLEEPIVGVAYKDGFCSFSISKSGLNGEQGILARIINVFSDNKIPIEFVPTGIDDISVIVTQEKITNLNHIYSQLQEATNNAEISFKENLGSLVVAGKGIAKDYHIPGEIEITLVLFPVELKEDV